MVFSGRGPRSVALLFDSSMGRLPLAEISVHPSLLSQAKLLSRMLHPEVTRVFARQEMFGTAAPHNHPRNHMVSGHIALGVGWVGFAERFEWPSGVFVVQLGRCVAHGPFTSPGSGGDHVGGLEQ